MSGRRLLMAFLLVAFMLTTSLPLVSVVSEAATGKVDESMLIDIRLDGADAVGTNLSEKFDLRMSYAYPERIQNFSYTAKVIDAETAGGEVTPDNGSSAKGVFQVEIKGRWHPGKMTVQVNATAQEIGGATWYRVKEFEIVVVKPVYVLASLVNRGQVYANDISVKMLVDGELERIEYYNMSADYRMDLNFSWVFTSMSEGEHVIKLVVNDPSSIIEFSTGDNVLTFKVYYSDAGNVLRGALVIMIIFVAVILVLTFLQKNTGAKKK